MLYFTATEVAKQLSDMLGRQAPGGFNFNYQDIFDEKIGKIVAKSSSVLIEDTERVLLNDF